MDQNPDASTHRLLAATEPFWVASPKWVRVFLGGAAVADSKRAHLLRPGGPPVYFFPKNDVHQDLLAPSSHRTESAQWGVATHWSVKVKDRVAENAAWAYDAPPADASFLAGHVAFKWDAMDAWFEENEEVFVHARDPFKRIDVLQSSRKVRVVVAGEVVAESDDPVILMEPGHPYRYYLPKADVRLDLLRPSATISRCPYKGEANYYSTEVSGKLVEDIAWSYRYPTPECGKIAGAVCFFNERVDALYVDSELMPKPATRWSAGA